MRVSVYTCLFICYVCICVYVKIGQLCIYICNMLCNVHNREVVLSNRIFNFMIFKIFMIQYYNDFLIAFYCFFLKYGSLEQENF